jgi:hypothetical protein
VSDDDDECGMSMFYFDQAAMEFMHHFHDYNPNDDEDDYYCDRDDDDAQLNYQQIIYKAKLLNKPKLRNKYDHFNPHRNKFI